MTKTAGPGEPKQTANGWSPSFMTIYTFESKQPHQNNDANLKYYTAASRTRIGQYTRNTGTDTQALRTNTGTPKRRNTDTLSQTSSQTHFRNNNAA